MRWRSPARIVLLLGSAALLAGCAAKPLADARPRLAQTPAQTSWDRQACAWEAQNAAGYQVDLSGPENTIYNLFAYARPSGAHDGSDPLLGRGGKARFDQVYAECLAKRGYDVPSPTAPPAVK